MSCLHYHGQMPVTIPNHGGVYTGMAALRQGCGKITTPRKNCDINARNHVDPDSKYRLTVMVRW
jgi:hypothetical protein